MVCDMKWPWSQTDGLNRWHNYFEMIKSRGGEPGCVNVHWNIKINMRLSRSASQGLSRPCQLILSKTFSPHLAHTQCFPIVMIMWKQLKIVGVGPYLLVWLHLESLGVQIFRKKVVTWWSWTRDQTISFPSWITQGPRTSLHLWTVIYFCDLILN